MERRVAGYDLARGLAVFGMVLVNFKFIMGLEGSESGWLGALARLFDGRAAATFVTLAGVGVSLLSAGARASKDAAALRACRLTLIKRAAFLAGIGFLDSFFWVGDILHFYAAYLAAAALLLDASDRVLLSAAAASAAAFAGLFAWLDYDLGWDWEALRYAGQWTPRGLVRHLFFNGFHPVFPWVSFLLVGMWLGRRAWDERGCRKLVAAGTVAALAAEGLSAILARWASDGTPEGAWCAALFGTQAMPPAPLYLVSGGGSALAVIGLCLLFAERWKGARWQAPVAAAGRLALTLYLAHVALGMAALSALGWSEGRSLELSLGAAAAFYAGAVAFAWAWSRRFKRGPAEALMRRVAD